MTEYGSAARRQVNEFQAVIDQHAVLASTGCCVACQVTGPCPLRREALYALAVRAELPRRRAGATRPELIGARRVWITG